MSDVAVAFFWHQHQPYYPDDLTGDNPMPWVRLHGVKDYLGMALHLLEVPEMRCTINLVPSLIVQLLAYTDANATDRPLEAARLPASSLSETDALYLLDTNFMANPNTMIRPFPRYFELYQRRGFGKSTPEEALKRFSERDLRDLQVWFNLAWIHPLVLERDADLRGLIEKGRNFTEAEKLWLLAKHRELLREIIPLHKKLQKDGQVELTTTPFYHPILPLLFDKKLAREAMPDVKLPRYTGGYPDDARLHVSRAVAQHEKLFGVKPTGMWPAEGSVCQSMLPLLAEHGIRWIATDEEILSHSTQGFISRDEQGHLRNPERLYQPYRVREGEHELGIVFRDHALSDMIGFHYQRSSGEDAARDFLRHLANIRQAIDPNRPALVSVILDGENCWEHYPEGGVPFLRSLYQMCTRTPGVRPVQIGAYLDENPPRDTLPHLFAGSWIHHNFAIWVGHDEDNTAWDALHRTREYLHKKAASAPADLLEKAWRELFIAEGSDWFWWYGDDHSSAQDALFDFLFRKHLMNVYLLLGDAPPSDLGRAISRRGHRPLYTSPRSFLQVRIDGKETFFEWLNAGKYTCQNERGSMAMVASGPLRDVYFGFDLEQMFVRIDFDRPARQALFEFDSLRIGFTEPAGFELRLDHLPRSDAKIAWLKNGVPCKEIGYAAACERIVEAAIPFNLLGVKPGQPIGFYVELVSEGQSRDRAPREGVIHFDCPSADFEQIMWDV